MVGALYVVAEQRCDVCTCVHVVCVHDGGLVTLFHGVTCVFGYGWTPTQTQVEKCDTGSHLLPLAPHGVCVRALCLHKVTRRA